MLKPIVWIFLLLAVLFGGTHLYATHASLYWYFWWFDIAMHFSGGVLITLGLFSLGTFKRIHRRPNIWLVLGVLIFAVVTWEVFEGYAGLSGDTLDTLQDMFLGVAGGLLTYAVFTKFKV